MPVFFITLTCVAIMLAYAIPGFICVKTKIIKPESISAFAVVLMYICQPCLTIYTLNKADYTPELLGQMLGFFALTFLLMLIIMLAFYFIFRKKQAENVKLRIVNIALCFGNVGFLGVPLLEAIFPENNNVLIFSVIFLVGMNLIGWTLGSAIITKDKKYISIKKALLNPAVIGLVIALPLFFTGIKLPEVISDAVTLLGKMTTPLCMLIMGMRLATVKIKSLFCSPLQYITIAFKQLIFPLIAVGIAIFLPFEGYIKQTLFILCCAPIASVVLNFAEMLGEGQETAANMVLLGTGLSVITIPVMTLLLGFIA